MDRATLVKSDLTWVYLVFTEIINVSPFSASSKHVYLSFHYIINSRGILHGLLYMKSAICRLLVFVTSYNSETPIEFEIEMNLRLQMFIQDFYLGKTALGYLPFDVNSFTCDKFNAFFAPKIPVFFFLLVITLLSPRL